MLALYVKVLCFLSVWQTANGIKGTLEPEINHVLEGGTAEFTCTITGRDKDTQEIWWDGFSSIDSLYWEYSATSQMVIQGEPVLFENFEFDYINTSNNVEVFMLRITNVTRTDSQPYFLCIYKDNLPGSGHTILGSVRGATLEIWDEPNCIFEGHIPIIISSQDSHRIDLSCTIDGSYPSVTQLSWYEMTQNGLRQVASPGYYYVHTVLYINASYHGREYVCQADTAAVLGENLFCTIIPYNPMPIIHVTSEKQIYTDGEHISIFCNNTGVSTNTTTYLWYINDMLINESVHGEITVINTMWNSTLSILNYNFSSDIVEIMCEGVIPNVASANAGLRLTLMRSDQTTNETMNQTPSGQGPTLIIIATASAIGSFVIIIIVILICCVCMKYKNSRKDVCTEYTATFSAEVTITSSPGPGTSNRSSMNLSHNESKTSEGQEQKDNIVPLYAAVSKNKNSDKVKANADGLAYADIEIAPKAQGNAGKDEIIRTENATVYAELKV